MLIKMECNKSYNTCVAFDGLLTSIDATNLCAEDSVKAIFIIFFVVYLLKAVFQGYSWI